MRSSRLVCFIISGVLLASPLAAGDLRHSDSNLRMSGGSEECDRHDAVVALGPKSGGLTMSASPTLFWFAAVAVRGKVTLTLEADESDDPLVAEMIDAPAKPGIYALSLADRKIKLTPGVGYTWSVALSVDPAHPERDVVATARIVLGVASAELTRKLLGAPEKSWPAILAAASLWYDAFAAASRQATADPKLRGQQSLLLEQAGLKAVAAFAAASGGK